MTSLTIYDAPTPSTVLQDHLRSLSPNTRRAYDQDIRTFEAWAQIDSAAAWFCSVDGGQANAAALTYRNSLSGAPATISRRLSGLRTLVSILRASGLLSYALEIKGPKHTDPVRDVRSPGREAWEDAVGRAGPRLLACLLLLHDLGLRRAEVCNLDLEHLESGYLLPTRKGHGAARFRKRVPERTLDALRAWLDIRGSDPGPLFTTSSGRRLLPGNLYREMRKIGITPHRIRHHVCTTALRKTNGNVAAVAAFLGHSGLGTVKKYWDEMQGAADEVAQVVAT